MAVFTIEQGAHYPRVWPLSVLPWVGKREMTRYVTFDASCAYDAPAYHAQDVNKLFGLSFGLRGIHYNSARFGWRWSRADQCIELLAYCYVNGTRNWDEQLRFPVVAQVPLGQEIKCRVLLDHDPEYGQPVFRFLIRMQGSVYQKEVNTIADLPHFGFTSGFYFGGALAAPHRMSARIDRKL